MRMITTPFNSVEQVQNDRGDAPRKTDRNGDGDNPCYHEMRYHIPPHAAWTLTGTSPYKCHVQRFSAADGQTQSSRKQSKNGSSSLSNENCLRARLHESKSTRLRESTTEKKCSYDENDPEQRRTGDSCLA